jgi:hypothetical protein
MKPSTILSLLAAPATLLSIAAPAAAQPAPAAIVTAEEAPEPKNSINLNPLSLAFGNLSVTYERRLDAHNSVVVDVGGGGRSDDQIDESHGFIGAGWRYHLRGRNHGSFVGAMIHQSYGAGETMVNDGSGEEVYAMTIYSTMVTANAGYRWMLGDRWNATVRLGLGWGKHTAVAQEDSEDARMAEDFTNDVLQIFPIGVDGELSVGYAF